MRCPNNTGQGLITPRPLRLTPLNKALIGAPLACPTRGTHRNNLMKKVRDLRNNLKDYSKSGSNPSKSLGGWLSLILRRANEHTYRSFIRLLRGTLVYTLDSDLGFPIPGMDSYIPLNYHCGHVRVFKPSYLRVHCKTAIKVATTYTTSLKRDDIIAFICKHKCSAFSSLQKTNFC